MKCYVCKFDDKNPGKADADAWDKVIPEKKGENFFCMGHYLAETACENNNGEVLLGNAYGFNLFICPKCWSVFAKQIEEKI